MKARIGIGIAALGVLAALSVLMAAAGSELVPAAGRGDDPGWLAGLYGDGFGLDGGSYIHLERAALVAYAVILGCAGALPRRLLGWAIVALVALFALAPPLLSLDLFSYVSYARLDELHGINPYEEPPASVPGDEALAFVEDWRDDVSVYGPLFTLAVEPLSHLGLGGAVWALKILTGIAVLAIAWIVSRLAAFRGVDPGFAAAVVALNPLVLVHVVGGAHNDAVMAALMTFAIAGIVLGRQAIGGAGIAAAAAVKASGALVAPFALIGAGRRGRILFGLAVGAALVVAVGLLAFGTAVDNAAKVVGQNQSIATRASVPGTLSRELGFDLDTVRTAFLVGFGLVLAALLAWTARGADWVRATGWGSVALLCATSYLTPWYAIWALPHVAVARDRALTIASLILSAFLLREQVPGLGG